MIGIYKITSPSGKIYIGQSRDLQKRKTHYEKYIKQSCRQVKLIASFNKHGFDKHVFEIVEECDFENLNKRERYWQEFYNSIEKGLNCLYTKTSEKPALFGKDTRDKMKKAQTGKKVSKETREKMSKKRKGFVFSRESRLKMSNSAKGKPKNLTKEVRERLSSLAKKRKVKPISCLSPEGVYFEFDSFKSAAFHIGVNQQSIRDVLYKISNKSGVCKKWYNFKLIEIIKKDAHI